MDLPSQKRTGFSGLTAHPKQVTVIQRKMENKDNNLLPQFLATLTPTSGLFTQRLGTSWTCYVRYMIFNPGAGRSGFKFVPSKPHAMGLLTVKHPKKSRMVNLPIPMLILLRRFAFLGKPAEGWKGRQAS